MSTSASSSKLGALAGRFNELFPMDWELVRHAGAEPVPYHLKKWWFCLGGTAMVLFIVQVITGIMLAFYYVPSPDHAYASVETITHGVRYGWFIRSIHMWSSNFMIVAVFLHMLRVFFTRSYRNPRQLNWMVGVMLLGLTLTFGFTGYSLVYEQLSFWGATVGCNLAGALPLIGPWVGDFMRGGPEVGEQTLTRFYMLHVAILPVIAFILLGIHVMIIRLHGVTELQFEGEVITDDNRFFRFWPEHVTMEILVGVLLMYILTILALIFPADLGAQADPTTTPAHIKPEWYFYFNYRMLKLTTLKMSVALTGALGGVLFFWPFIDGWIEKRLGAKSDRIVVLIGTIAFLAFLGLTIWEAVAAH
ncbi:MAG: cytochrome bc complex cytochrome b subunit [Thermoanaerobaculales bacterium]|nr:cytochrome bc complex cytochrome b subunit [Thermoanaerobaculales bacterium]